MRRCVEGVRCKERCEKGVKRCVEGVSCEERCEEVG